MEFDDFIPFRSEYNKASYGLNTNAAHTSEKPLFEELKVRRYNKTAAEISQFILNKIDHWVGWQLISEKTAVGGINTIRAEVSSFILFGLKINLTFGLFEEKDINGLYITTVNAKAVTHIESKGDLGESRRAIRMMLGALDFDFRTEQIMDDDYQYRSMGSQEAAFAFQEMFNEAAIQHSPKPEGAPKATTSEFKKKPAIQTIPLTITPKSEVPVIAENSSSETTGLDKSMENSTVTVNSENEAKPLKPKIIIVTNKKNL